MTTTPDLIDALVADLRPVPTGAVWRRIALGVLSGLILSMLLMVLWLGVRPDLAGAVLTAAYWIKFAYTLLLGGAALFCVERLARPGASPRRGGVAAALVFLIVAVLAGLQYAGAPPAAHRALLMGSSAKVCPAYIVALSIPLYLGALWALRGLAPTRPTLTGAAAGLLAGGLGAWVYAFHCDETAIPFLATWYSLGIAVSGALGALIGRYALRWR